MQAAGILPDHDIARLLRCRRARGRSGRSMPTRSSRRASTCRLGATAWRVRASFLPGPATAVADKLDRLKLHEIDLTDGAVLETGCVYIVPLMERLALPADDVGLGQSEELDRPARHLHPRHDRSRPGVRQDPGRLCRAALSRSQPAHLPDRRARAARACRRSASAPAMRCSARSRTAWRCIEPRCWSRPRRRTSPAAASRCRST